MIWFTPTTKVSILRGMTETDYGDVIPSDTPVYTGIPASIAEFAVTDMTTDARDEVVNRYSGLLPFGTDIRIDDVLLDEYYGRKFAVLAVIDSQPIGPFKGAPISVVLRFMVF